jgi:hypothetical protein
MNGPLQKATNFYHQNKYPLFLVLLILLVLYPLTLFQYIPKWDNINGYLPYRYFISDYLWNGHLPLWNPFQRFGYPGYADLQSGCWYPLVWVLMLFGKYDITSLIIELLSCFIIAGLGMYKLSNYIHQCKKTAFILGLSFALSGFMVGSAQLMVFLVGVAWLPWCIWALLRFFETQKYKHMLLTALFVSLQITSASPAFTIILVYIFVGMFLYQFWKYRTAISVLKKNTLGGIFLVATMAVLLLPYIKSFLDFSPYFNRADKLEYQGFLIANPFVLADYWSFLFPYTVIAKCDWFKLTDLSMRNASIGLLGFVAFIFSLTRLKRANKYAVPLLFGVVFSMMLAFGDEFFIYKYLYHLPGFGLFRHPSFFRVYAMFCMLLLAGFWFKQVFENNAFSRNERKAVWAIIFIFLGVFVVAGVNTTSSEIAKNIDEIFDLTEFHSTDFYAHLVVNVVAFFLILGITALLTKTAKLSIFKTLMLFMVLDIAVQTRLMAPSTLHYNIEYSEFKNYFNSLPNQLNQTYNNTPFKQLDDTQGLMATKGIWQNVATFNKTISSVGVNPMRFKTFDIADENGALERIKENPLLYFPTQTFNPNDTLKPGYIWGTPTPVVIKELATTISDVKIDYNKFSAKVTNAANENQWLVLNQNHHYLWKAFFNGEELLVHQVNEMVMGVEIPKNADGTIEFVYSSPKLMYAFMISLLGYITIACLLLFRFRKTVVKQK